MCIPSGGGLFGKQWDRAFGFDIPSPPKPAKVAPPPDQAQPTAAELGSPQGLKDAQALAARMGTNSLIIPFQSLNAP